MARTRASRCDLSLGRPPPLVFSADDGVNRFRSSFDFAVGRHVRPRGKKKKFNKRDESASWVTAAMICSGSAFQLKNKRITIEVCREKNVPKRIHTGETKYAIPYRFFMVFHDFEMIFVKIIFDNFNRTKLFLCSYDKR